VKCPAITRKGTPCKGLVTTGSGWCPSHDPSRAEARSRAASKAARSKPGTELAQLKSHLRTIAGAVLDDRLDARNAAVSIQALNTVVRIIELERRLRDADEVESRNEA